ncbi:hypothetical protein ABBQ32_008771 [Trebouxia sp. C0010 RCD-2024]
MAGIPAGVEGSNVIHWECPLAAGQFSSWCVTDACLVKLLCTAMATPAAQRSPGLGSSASGLQLVYSWYSGLMALTFSLIRLELSALCASVAGMSSTITGAASSWAAGGLATCFCKADSIVDWMVA